MSPTERKRHALFALYGALLDLLAKQPENTISVTALCRHAKVSRSYYYKHYITFDDVIKQAIFVGSVDYLRALPATTPHKTSANIARYFQMMLHTREEQTVLLRVGKERMLQETFATVQHFLFVHNYLNIKENSYIKRKYWEDFLSGAVVNVTTRWLQNGCQETPEQMGQLIAGFMATD